MTLRGVRVALAFATCTGASLAIAREPMAQVAAPVRGMTYYTEGVSRLLNSAEREDRTPWRPIGRSDVALDSAAVTGGAGSLTFHAVRNTDDVSTRTIVWRGPRGGVDSITAHVDPLSPSRRTAIADATRAPSAVSQVITNDDPFAAIEQLSVYLGDAPRAGKSLPFHVSVGNNAGRSQRADGVTVSRWVSDTVIVGRTHHVMRDSTMVTVTSESPRSGNVLRGSRVDTRRLQGTIVGRRIHDPARDVSIAVTDTVQMTGTETRRYADGHSASDAVTFARRRTISLLDSAQRRAITEADSRIVSFPIGMAIRPPLRPPSIDVSNKAVQDSLIVVYAKSASVAHRDSIRHTFDLMSQSGVQARLVRIHIAEGDTSNALKLISVPYGAKLSLAEYALLQGLLRQPDRGMRFGYDVDVLYDALESRFATDRIDRAADSLRWWCEPAACRAIANEWPGASERQLRTLGLIANYALDPDKWADTVIALEKSGERQLSNAAGKVRARIAAINGERGGVKMPELSADWHAWYNWLKAGKPTLSSLEQMYGISGTALEAAQERTHLSYRDTFALRFSTASIDTARYVYYIIAAALKAPAPDTSAVFRSITSTNAFDKLIGAMEVSQLSFAQADSATATQIERDLLTHYITGASMWPPIDSTQRAIEAIAKNSRLDSTFIAADSLTSESTALLRAAGIAVRARSWQIPNEASGFRLELNPVQRAGPFASIFVTWQAFVRLPDGRGGGNYGSDWYFLVRVNGEWRLVKSIGVTT